MTEMKIQQKESTADQVISDTAERISDLKNKSGNHLIKEQKKKKKNINQDILREF